MFWRGLFGYLPVQAVDALIGVGAVVAFTRLLTPEQFGHYALAFSAAALVQSLFLVWTEAAMERFHVQSVEAGEARDHLSTIHRAYVALATLGGLTAAGILAVVSLNPDLELALAAGAAAVIVNSGLKLIQHRRRAEGRVGVYAVTDLLCLIGGFAGGLGLAVAGLGGAAPAIGVAVAALLGLLLSLPGELARARGGRFQPERARRYAAYGLPLAFSLMLGTLLASMDRFLIAGFLDEAQVGIYHAGYGLAHRTLDIMFIWLGLAGAPALIAALERRGLGAMQDAARLQGEVMVLVALPAAVGIALVAQPTADLLLGAALRDGAAQVMPWIAASAFFAGMTTHYLRQAFTLGQRPGLLFVVIGITAAANLVLNLVLIPRFGLDGAVWATTGSFVLGAVGSWALGRRVMPLPLPIEALARCGLAAAAMAAALSFL
ncbi:MAG TPA: lipopolysaccharide biosynthesis protein, partial [Caulobacteraceae bacterium]